MVMAKGKLRLSGTRLSWPTEQPADRHWFLVTSLQESVDLGNDT